MRQRTTFVHEPQDGIDPKSIGIAANTLSLSGLRAAREDRITLSLAELPRELRHVLGQAQELHIRYVRPSAYKTIPPFNARLSPGLHVYYSPNTITEDQPDLLCPLIDRLFDLEDKSLCQTPEISFTSLPSQTFQHGTGYEYYLPESQISMKGASPAFTDYLKGFCVDQSCKDQIEQSSNAAYIDFDFDTISDTVSVTSFWEPQTWDADIGKAGLEHRVEVGILSNEKPLRLGELNMNGFLTVVGEDEKPSPTMFSFPARHHKHAASFGAAFIQPTGLHPTLGLAIRNSIPPKDHDKCSLHAHLTIPRSIFPDKYQLKDPLFLASKNLTALQYVTKPVDLEAPEYSMSLWGSSLLLELAPPPASAEPWTAEIPLHLRYLLPSDSGYRETALPSPALFWACAAGEGTKFTINPFDRVNLGYEGLFDPKTMFYHLSPEGGPELYSSVTVPVLNTTYSGHLELGTTAVILLGFGWVLWKLWLGWRDNGYGSGEPVEAGSKKKQ